MATEIGSTPEGVLEGADVRGLFTELVAGALDEQGTRISPIARSYLIELLLEQVPSRAETEARSTHHAWALAQGLVEAREEPSLERVPRLRALGDRALFVAGFFRSSLGRRRAEPRTRYEEVGRAAYSDISRCLAVRVREPTWSGLFAELAERFEVFEDLLAEVGAWARPDPATDLLRTVDRYVRTGNPHDRARLLARGVTLPPRHDRSPG